MVGGVLSTTGTGVGSGEGVTVLSSCAQDVKTIATHHAARMRTVARNAATKGCLFGWLACFVQVIESASWSLWVASSRIERYRGMRRLTTSDASFVTWCAYPRAAAVPTCLYIPIQLNKACFLYSEFVCFPALAPMLPAIPILAAGL